MDLRLPVKSREKSLPTSFWLNTGYSQGGGGGSLALRKKLNLLGSYNFHALNALPRVVMVLLNKHEA